MQHLPSRWSLAELFWSPMTTVYSAMSSSSTSLIVSVCVLSTSVTPYLSLGWIFCAFLYHVTSTSGLFRTQVKMQVLCCSAYCSDSVATNSIGTSGKKVKSNFQYLMTIIFDLINWLGIYGIHAAPVKAKYGKWKDRKTKWRLCGALLHCQLS